LLQVLVLAVENQPIDTADFLAVAAVDIPSEFDRVCVHLGRSFWNLA